MTMKTPVVALLGTLLVLPGCQPESDAARSDEDSYSTPRPSPSELDDEFHKYLEENYTSPGKWVEKNGSQICDGYLTRYEESDYCIAELPDGWLPFEFDGKTYYVVPLDDKDE